MRRRRVIVGLVVGTAIGVVAGILFWPRGPQPCRATFALVREGMTVKEIQAVVGRPPGAYNTNTVLVRGPFSDRPAPRSSGSPTTPYWW